MAIARERGPKGASSAIHALHPRGEQRAWIEARPKLTAWLDRVNAAARLDGEAARPRASSGADAAAFN